MYAKKNSGRKLIAVAVLLALVIGCVAGGTLAWLLTKTDPLVNTFVSGDINIQMVEHKLNLQTGEHTEPEEWVDGQEGIELLPGRTVYKDPTVVVKAGSEPCYVRVFMVVDYGEGMDDVYEGIEAIKKWFKYSSDWTIAHAWDEITGDTCGHVIEFQYIGVATTDGDDTYLPAVFSSITIPADLDKNEQNEDMYYCLKEAELMFIAQAVQAEGFEAELDGDGKVTKTAAEVAFEEVGYPDVTLSMNDGDMTLEALIERNIAQKDQGNSNGSGQ